jgi:Glycosyltransferase like family 2
VTNEQQAVDVVVPTFRRPLFLGGCLDALFDQSEKPATIIVVVREGDTETEAVLAGISSPEKVTTVVVRGAGVVAAMTAGIAASRSPLLAFTDDDARPRRDWLARIVAHFTDPTVGAVGGRDVIAGRDGPRSYFVGRYTRIGRYRGNHHLGIGKARDVHVLKGVNMAFRARALALPARGTLRGEGAEVDFEVLACGWARRQGWRVIYDPQLLVDHRVAPRQGEEQRDAPNRQAVFDASYNSFAALAAVNGTVPWRVATYALFVGSRDRPGLLRAGVALCRREYDVAARLRPAVGGRIAALSTFRSSASLATSLVSASAMRLSQERVLTRLGDSDHALRDAPARY